jgi:hypothetical protein
MTLMFNGKSSPWGITASVVTINHLRNHARQWFEDYSDRGGVFELEAMLDDARHWSTHTDETDADIADWYADMNTDAANAVDYLERLV